MGSERKPGRLHSGAPPLGQGVVWKDGRGWRIDCPAACGRAPGFAFATAAAAAGAFRDHWTHEKEAEVAALARWRLDGADFSPPSAA